MSQSTPSKDTDTLPLKNDGENAEDMEVEESTTTPQGSRGGTESRSGRKRPRSPNIEEEKQEQEPKKRSNRKINRNGKENEQQDESMKDPSENGNTEDVEMGDDEEKKEQQVDSINNDDTEMQVENQNSEMPPSKQDSSTQQGVKATNGQDNGSNLAKHLDLASTDDNVNKEKVASPVPATNGYHPAPTIPSQKTSISPVRETALAKTPYEDQRGASHPNLDSMVPPPTVNHVVGEGSITLVSKPALPESAPEPLDDTPSRTLGSAQKSLFGTSTSYSDSPNVFQQSYIQHSEIARTAPSLFSLTPLFFIFILFLQVMFPQYTINPVWTFVMEISDDGVLYYKKLMGVEPTKRKNVTTVDVPVPSPPVYEEKVVEKRIPSSKPDPKDDRRRKLVSDLSQAFASFSTSSNKVSIIATEWTEKLTSIEAELKRRQDELEAWTVALATVNRDLDAVITRGRAIDSHYIVDSFSDFNRQSRVEVDPLLLDTSSIPMWTILSPQGCPEPEPIAITDVAVTIEDIQSTKHSLMQITQRTLSDLVDNKELLGSIETWVEQLVEEPIIPDVAGKLQHVQTMHEDELNESREQDEPLEGMTTQTVQKAIDDRLELDFADETGTLDYASIHNGAQVITSGSRKTSPSLKDTLPLFNRLLHDVKLRFYGHGPEVALTPTIPKDALGQCWSFENASRSRSSDVRLASHLDPACGRFGTLSIRLSKPIQIGSVLIDHGGQLRSAIRDFRLSGYTDPDAAGPRIDLGSFRSDPHTRRLLEFSIDKPDLPLIQSITLAIDSTHGNIYACLYRFRVLEYEEQDEEEDYDEDYDEDDGYDDNEADGL